MTASPFNSVITRFRAPLLVHMKSDIVVSEFEMFNDNADNEETLHIGMSSHYIGSKSFVNDVVEFSSLRESGGLRSDLGQRLF